MATALTDELGVSQGRIQPANHTPSSGDNPTAAVLTSAASEPFPLEHGLPLQLRMNGGAIVEIEFDQADFADITEATALEIAAVLSAALADATAADSSGKVRVTTDEAGSDKSIEVVGGAANNVLLFPNLAQGSHGVWSFVLGSDRVRTVKLAGGDSVTVHHAGHFVDAGVESTRLFGAVRIPQDIPAGYDWLLHVGINGVGQVSRSFRDLLDQGFETATLNDLGVNTSQLGAAQQTLEITLELDGPATATDLELPGVYLDYTEAEAEAEDLFLVDRFPAPGQAKIPHELTTLQLTIADTTGTGISLADTTITVDGTVAYTGGAFQGAFAASSTATAGAGVTGDDVEFLIDVSHLSFTDEQEIDVRVQSDVTGGGSALDTTYSFTMADVDQPQVTSVLALNPTTLRVSFNEAMLMDTSAAGALNPSNYSLAVESIPAVPIVVDSVTQVSEQVVDLALDQAASFGATYGLTVGPSVEDDDGNVIDPANDYLSFSAFRPPSPEGRSFRLWDMLPGLNRREDAQRKVLRPFILCMQELADSALYDIDRWTDILDPDFAPDSFLDALLSDAGNPFSFENLSALDKRRLIRVLIEMYREKGTAIGIINAVRFFVGVEVQIEPVVEESFWSLGTSTLGEDTVVAPADGSPLWYSFRIISPVVLTPEQRTRILQIADYLKPAHEHIVELQEPGLDPPEQGWWTLGVSLLGEETYVQ